MSIYAKDLINEGITAERAESITSALDRLHCALSAVDYKRRQIFFETTIEQRLADYAKAEGLADVTAR